MRKSLTAASLIVAVLALSACEKPAPSVTVFSGAQSVHTEAACWAADCATLPEGLQLQTLAVTPGGVFGISVDSEIAEAGWQPAILVDGQWQALEKRTIHKRYWRMTFPEGTRGAFPANGYALQIVSAPTADGVRGAWLFSLVDAETVDNA